MTVMLFMKSALLKGIVEELKAIYIIVNSSSHISSKEEEEHQFLKLALGQVNPNPINTPVGITYT